MTDTPIEETTWTPLAMHAKRNALFFVDRSVGLETAAKAVANDRQAIVAHWIESGMLRRPTDEERTNWDGAPESHRFRFVIVQPFVLVEL